MLAFEVIDIFLWMFSAPAVIGMFALVFAAPVLVVVSAVRWMARLRHSRESDVGGNSGSDGPVRSLRGIQFDRMTKWGWVAIGLAAVWAAWSVLKLVSMTISDIAALTDPLAGLDPIPDAQLTLFQRDGAWTVVWLGLPVLALVVVCVMHRRGIALVVGTALVPIAIFTRVLAFEAFPIAILLTLSGYLGPRPPLIGGGPSGPDAHKPPPPIVP